MGEPASHESGGLPPEFPEMLAQLVSPGESAAVGAAFEQALELDDDALAMFLTLVRRRLDSSPELLRADELVRLVEVAASASEAPPPPA